MNYSNLRHTNWIIERLEELESDDVVDILKELPAKKFDFIIKKFDKSYLRKIKELIKYPEKTAGSLMSADFLAVNKNASLTNIIKRFRRFKEEEIENIQFVYVADQHNYLLGYIPLRRLILKKGSQMAKDIMIPIPFKVTPFMDQEEVAKIFKDYDLITLPVVDERGTLLGKITIDDVVDVLEEEASEDVFKMMGLSTEKKITSIFLSLKSRFPWMLINLITTAIAAFVIDAFNPTIQKFIILAAFMPMVAALGGATGNQMVAIIIRGITVGLHLKQVWGILMRELSAVFLGSLLIGILITIFSFQTHGNSVFGLLISSSLVLNMLFATIIGAAIPLFLKFFKFDPAMGSSVLVAACTDIIGFLIFLSIAAYVLG